MKPHSEENLIGLLVIAMLVLGGLAIAVGQRPRNYSASGTQETTTPLPPSDTPFADVAASPTTQYPATYPIGKQTLEARVEQTRAAVTIVSPAGTSFYNPPTPQSAQLSTQWDWGTGILHSGDAPFPAMQYVIYNQWYGMLNGDRVQVYAGGIKDNPGISQDASQGVLIVLITTPDQIYSPEIYRTPTKAGPLRILEANGERLKLALPNTTVSFFDVPARQFVASLTAPILVVTSSPKSVPTAAIGSAYP